jgi:hypothetical protein
LGRGVLVVVGTAHIARSDLIVVTHIWNEIF